MTLVAVCVGGDQKGNLLFPVLSGDMGSAQYKNGACSGKGKSSCFVSSGRANGRQQRVLCNFAGRIGCWGKCHQRQRRII